MRRMLSWAAGVGLLAGTVLLLVVPAGGQTPTAITLSWTVTDDMGNAQATTSVNEGEQVNGYVRATVPSSVTGSAVTVSVTMGASGSSATFGNSCTATGTIFTAVTINNNCGGDYGVYGGASINNTTFNITIPVGSSTASSTGFIRATSDTITENNEIVRISGTTTASGYSVPNNLDITINDQDRVIRPNDVTVNEPTDSEEDIGDYKSQFISINGTVGGVAGGVFTASTSSTFSNALLPNLYLSLGTATGSDILFPDNGYAQRADAWMEFLANDVTGPFGNPFNTGVLLRVYNDAVAEPDETVNVHVANAPSGFTGRQGVITVKDSADTRVVLSVDTDSGEDGNQLVLAEGGSGSGVSVSGAFPAGVTSSTIGSASVVTLSAAGEASPSAGEAGSGDLSYAPQTPNTFTIAANMITSTGSASLAGLSVTDDSVVEGPETFTVGGSSTLGDAGEATVTIIDDDSDVTLSLSTVRFEEGAGAVDVTVTAAFAGSSSVLTTPTDVTVTLAAEAVGGAVPGPDFTVSGTGVTNNSRFTVRIPAQSTTGSTTVRVTAVLDADEAEATEGVVVSGAASIRGSSLGVAGTRFDIDNSRGITLTLHDTDGGALSEISEDGGQQTVRVMAEAGTAVSSDTTVAVMVGASGGTAASCTGSGQNRMCTDYTPGMDTVDVTILSGQTTATADVQVTPVVDAVAEDRETIRYSGTASGFIVVPADLGITDSIDGIELTLSASSVDEGANNAGSVTVTAGFAGASSSERAEATDVTLSFTAGEGADAAADFGAPGTAVTLRIPAGSAASTATALTALTITQDTEAEGPEVIDVDGAATGFSVTGTALTITDDDMEVTLTVEDTDSIMPGVQKTLSEGGSASVRVRAAFGSGVTNALDADLTVSVTAGEGSPPSARSGGVDFTAPASPVTVTIPTGQTQSTWTTLTGLRVTDDTVAEGAETFLVTGTVPGGTTVTSDTLTIGASDNQLVVSVSPGTVLEQAGGQTITVTAGFRGASTSELGATRVNVTVATGDTNGATLATSCPDTSTDACTNTSTFNFNIPARQTSGNDTFSLTARDDSTAEAGFETLKITGTVNGSTNTDSATLRIADSGIQIELLNPADDTALPSLTEGGGSAVRVRVTMPAADPNAQRVVGLKFSSRVANEDANGVWDAGEDYRVTGTRPTGTPAGHQLGVVIPAAQTVVTQDFTITINDDSISEDTETIQVTGDDVGNIPVVGTTLEITDNDTAPTNIDLTLQTTSGQALTGVREDASTTIRVVATYQGATVLSRGVTVPITIGKASGEATPGTDYQTVSDFDVTIPAFQSSGNTTFIMNPTDDADVEGAETVTVAGGTVTGFTIADTSFSILDDEVAVTLKLLDSSDQPVTSLQEGTASATVKLQASYPDPVTRPAAQTVRITFGGTAVAGDDYQTASVPDPFDITINSGDNSATSADFTLALDGARDDRIAEGDETLTINGALTGFIVEPATITITDNDDPPTRIEMTTPSSSRRLDEGERAQVTVRFPTGSSALPVATTVTITTSGNARSGTDYNAPRSVIIPARGTQVPFTVRITQDSTPESDETIILTARTADYGNASLTLTIPANDQPTPGGGGGGAPPPSGGGGGGGGGAPPPAGPPAPPPPPAAPVCQGRFCDDDGSVHQANIEQIAAWEITLGCDADDAAKFCPSAQITRRQMAAFLYRAVTRIQTIEPPAGIEITDVPADAWYRTFAEWVVSTGAFVAPDGVFNPGGVVTRADMAVMMIASFPDINAVDEPEGLFNDVAGAAPEVVRAVEGMYHTGVTRGCSVEPLNYCPDQPVTRAQMASFFVRAVNYTPPAGEDS